MGVRVGRRTLVGALAGVALTARAQAQSPAKTVGVLVLGSPDPKLFIDALRGELGKLGYTEGRNLRLLVESAESRMTTLPDAARRLIAAKVDVIVSWQTPASQAAKDATKDIPIVISAAGNPLGTGLVPSLARPGGNLTGTSSALDLIAGKTVQFIRDLLPAARRVAVLGNAIDPLTESFVADTAAAAKAARMEAEPFLVRPSEDYAPAFEGMRRKSMDALVVQGSIMNQSVADLARQHRLPSFSANRQLPIIGGLMSYSADFADITRETARYVDRILKGARPAELPVSQPSRFELVINTKTAALLGITLPLSLTEQASRLIE